MHVYYTYAEAKDFSDYEYVQFQTKMIPGNGTVSMALSFFLMQDSVSAYAYTAYFDDNVNGITSMSSDTWYTLRIPLTLGAGDPTDVKNLNLTFVFTLTSAAHQAYFDNLFLERAERVATIKDERSIKTFGLFEKRKRDTNLWEDADVLAAAQGLMNPYPKMNYSITANGYVPMRLNQTIGVRWKEVDWVLPLSQKRIVFKAGITNSMLTFGGKPLSADDINSALAADTRAETYGKVIRHRGQPDAGNDPLNHETVTVDDGIPTVLRGLGGLSQWAGKSPSLLSLGYDYYGWDHYPN